MLIFIKSIKQNDFISLYYLPIYKQIAPQFFLKTKKRNKYLSFYQKPPRFFLYLSSIKPNTISSLKVTKIRKSVSLYGIVIRHST